MKSTLVAIAATVALLAPVGPANAVKEFANCTKLTKVYPNGVAKNRNAANKQVDQGNPKPAVKPRVYNKNSGLDRDKDGTACEG